MAHRLQPILPRRHRGAGMVEYVLITVFVALALALPYKLNGDGLGSLCENTQRGCSAVERLMNALKREHAGYLYAASLPSLPLEGGWDSQLPPSSGGSGGNSGSSGPGPGPGEGQGGGSGDGGSGGGGGGGDPGGVVAPGQPDGGGSGGVGQPGPGDPPGGGSGGDGGGSVGLPGLPGLPGGPGQPPGSGLLPGDPDGPGNGGPAQCAVAGPHGEDGAFSPAAASAGLHADVGFPTSLASTHVGNPVHAVTGNKYQREADLVLPGGPAFVRHYNSHSRYHGLLGARWRHSYDVQIHVQGDSAYIWQADGRRVDFRQLRRDRHGTRHYRAAQHSDGTLSIDRSHTAVWRWPDGASVTFSFSGHLVRLTDARGHSTYLDHDEAGRLTTVIGPGNRTLRLAHDGDGRIRTLTGPEGHEIHYGYDDAQRLVRVVYPDGTMRRYHYEDAAHPHHLTGISVASSAAAEADATRIATWHYDDQGRTVYSSHADEVQQVTLEYGEHETRVTNSQGETSVYKTSTANGIPHVTAVHGPGCSTCGVGDVEYRYNRQFQLVALARKDGSALSYAHDRHGRLERVTFRTAEGAERTLARFSYLGDTQKVETAAAPSVKAGSERTITVRYDEEQRPIEVIERGFAPQPDGSYTTISRSQSMAYEDRRKLHIRGHRNDVDANTTIDWQPEDALWQVNFPDGGAIKVLEQDRQGRPVRIQTDDRAPITLQYDARGRIRSVGNDRGRMVFGYDAQGRLQSVDTPLGPFRYERDAAGRLVHATGPDGEQQRYEWDSESRLLARERRDALGQMLARQESPVAGRANASAAMPVALDAVHGARPVLVFDGVGNLAGVTDPLGNTTRYGVDDFGRKVFVDSPDTGLAVYEYDEADNLRRKTIATGLEARFDYDPGDRLVAAHVEDGTTEFMWAGAQPTAPVKTIRGPKGFEQYDYDEAGRITQHIRGVGGQEYTTSWRYDRRGRLVEQVLPDGRRIGYRYHRKGANAGLLASIVEKRRLKRDVPLLWGMNDEEPESTVRSFAGPNGLRTVLHREDGRLAALETEGVHSFRYHYDAQGRIVGIDDMDQIKSRYRFDALGRLDFALTPRALYGYRYDDNGNRTRLVVNGRHTKYEYAPGSNRLLRIDSLPGTWSPPMLADPGLLFAEPAAHSTVQVSANYRASGEPDQLGDLRLVYNGNGQLEEVWRGQSRLARYVYNSRAQRIKKLRFDEQGTVQKKRHYLYDDQRLTAEADGNGEILRQYLYQGHHPVALLTENGSYAIHTNHLGAPIAVTDNHRRIVWQARYAPFGRAEVDEDPDGDGERLTLNLRLPGQYEDVETGLYYNHHRYYDPDLGRYLSSDPLGLRAGLNTYAYVANDPVNHIDPTGLLLFAFDGTGNNDPPGGRRDISNVVRMRDAYQGDIGELATPSGTHYYYMSGPGTNDRGSGIRGAAFPDGAFGGSMPDRVRAMGNYLIDYIEWLEQHRRAQFTLNLDVVGFSRGAASARMFVNWVQDYLDGESYHNLVGDGRFHRVRFNRRAQAARDYLIHACVNVNLRFLGLFDTVPHYGANQAHNVRQLNLEIPEQVDHAAHAVAVNEDRRDFHGVSIHDSPATRNSARRLELGFIGAHSDIGGGYAEGDLSNVAFMWMVQRARAANVRLDATHIEGMGWHEVRSPALHDSLGVAPFFLSGRDFKYLNSRDQVAQREWTGFGMDFETSEALFDSRYMTLSGTGRNRRVRKGIDHSGNRTLVGMVDEEEAQSYGEWLRTNYGLTMEIKVDPERVLPDGRPGPVIRTWEGESP